MPTDRELADRAAAAYAMGAIRHPGLARQGAVYDEGGLLGRATGSPAPYFNWLYVTADEVPDAALAEAVAWFDEREQPFTVRLRAHQTERYDGMLRQLHFAPQLVMPGMVASPVPRPAIRTEVEGFVIVPVTSETSYLAFTARVAPGSPDDWLTTEMYRDFMTTDAIDDRDFAMLVGYVDGRPVANAAARVDEGVVVVFAVGTDPAYRRRGIGTAVTGAALDWGRGRGADLAFLTSSEMARSMYDAMGFRAVDTWSFYLRPWPTP